MAVSFKLIESDNPIDTLLNEKCTSYAVQGFVEIQVGKDKYVWAKTFPDFEEKIRKLQVRDDDVILAAYPKTGTTWATEMIWMIVNNFNYEKAKEVVQMRSPLLEFSTMFDSSIIKSVDLYNPDSMSYIDTLKSPRCYKTHLPFPLLPEQIKNGSKKPKIITVLRNPKDTCVSLFHHGKMMERSKTNFEESCELFLHGRGAPGSMWTHVLSYWEQRHNHNILFIKYKDMKEDLSSVIREVAKFLEKTVSDEDVEKLTKHLSFDAMKNNSALNFGHVMAKFNIKPSQDKSFIRSGKEGGYRTLMSPEMSERFDVWTKENISGTGIVL